MRILLFTGKGGVGKSTVAAGTAALAAAEGRRTLVLSTDAAHSLADAFGCATGTIGSEPTEVADLLFVQQVDAQLRFEQSWADIQRYLLSVLDVAGVDPVAAEELTVIPGAEEVLALLELRLHALSGAWDVIVVDCAPTAETLRLLALPEALGWYIQRVLPVERRVVKALRPVLNRAAGVPMPGDSVFDAVERLHAELDEVRALLSGPDASVRLVLTPENVVLAEARRSYTTLSLFGYRVDGVVANRVFPAEDADDWRAGWVLAQDEVLDRVGESFAGLPVWRSEYRPREPVGVEALGELARELYGESDPLATTKGKGPFRISRNEAGAVLRLSLPLVSRTEVDLARNGDDLVVTVGSYRRLITLPSGLARFRIAGARVEQGELQVRFVEGPADEAGR
ncbi:MULTISPECIES: ArsA family ATPase [unclassified Nocardioides]|uniref:ArsA family ATPase n=1 Tax=unclassified Nocardioides TaxID=2615069 RepID=UPI0009F14453|nr:MULTISPECIES: ArsA family ATPase [unclassified Nocardioides]GAW52475.1 arsenite-transporting ATPase [Nocardioides sp. PD653-B2]GAW54656.1 arsenite-transporting ATPase [Nocardioides sp. PD653]